MQLEGARALVCGASGVLGTALTDGLLDHGASVVAAGRTADRLEGPAGRTGHEPVTFDAVDTVSCRAAVDAAAEALGGLDLLVVASGAAAFGAAAEEDDAVVEELFAVNVFGPAAMVRAAAPRLAESGGTAVVISAILADYPTIGMAAYSASKSGLAVWLDVLRREQRRRFRVLDVRPPHLDTGLATRALAGDPPSRLPEPVDSTLLTPAVLDGIERDVATLSWNPQQARFESR